MKPENAIECLMKNVSVRYISLQFDDGDNVSNLAYCSMSDCFIVSNLRVNFFLFDQCLRV